MRFRSCLCVCARVCTDCFIACVRVRPFKCLSTTSYSMELCVYRVLLLIHFFYFSQILKKHDLLAFRISLHRNFVRTTRIGKVHHHHRWDTINFTSICFSLLSSPVISVDNLFDKLLSTEWAPQRRPTPKRRQVRIVYFVLPDDTRHLYAKCLSITTALISFALLCCVRILFLIICVFFPLLLCGW